MGKLKEILQSIFLEIVEDPRLKVVFLVALAVLVFMILF